ncbi:MAG TPA: MauE/DoxX family redox-associated membrane protein [Thermoanaerobaculia bacterium]|nr:MauE/DoxX family redox-associated membrane protein [Thermoanaerobaculia bacterium]
MKRLLAHPWLTIRVQIALGAVFIIAALPKIADPPSFAHMIYNYRLVPSPLINISALVMPWVELLAGLALILSVWKAAARTVVAIMLAVFIVAISINLFRDNAIDCGCFNVADRGKTHEQRIFDMKVDVFRDFGMLLMVGQLWYAGKKEEDDV